MSTAEIFTKSFHNLPGLSVAEKRKNFYILLNQNSTFLKLNPSVVTEIIQNLKIENHLDHLFYVDFLIYFQRFEELAQEYLKNDEIVVSKIGKQKWFFTRIFEKQASSFVDQFLPTLSYNLRLKILKRVLPILTEDQANEIFDKLKEKYGVFMATNVLTSCSIDKIEQTLNDYPIKLWFSQLKLLYEKKPDLILLYLEERVKHEGDAKFLSCRNPLVKFIASKNPEMYCHLLEKYRFQHCLIGKRSTKKIIKQQKEKIIAKPKLYVDNLNRAKLVRTLGKDFEVVYQKIFPTNVVEAVCPFTVLPMILKHYPKKRQFPLLQNTFNDMFVEPLEKQCSSIDDYRILQLLNTLHDNKEREKLAQCKEKSANEEFYKYYQTENCLKKLKTKLSPLTSPKKRAEYFGIVTECCLINKDLNTLCTICRMINDQFKDDEDTIIKFLEILNKNTCEIFNSEVWVNIKPILLKTDNSKSSSTIFKYLEFCSKNNTLNKEEIVELLRNKVWINYIEKKNCWEKEVILSKEILLALMQLAPLIKGESTIETIDVNLLSACDRYNTKHPESKILVFDHPRMLESLISCLNQEDFLKQNREIVSSVVVPIICTNISNGMVEKLTTLFWKNFETLASTNAINWYLKHRPDLIVEHFDKFAEVVVFRTFCSSFVWIEATKPIWRRLKCYNHLQLDAKTITFCLKKLEEDCEGKNYIAEPLSILMNSKDFLNLMEKYKPSEPKVDMMDDNQRENFELRRHFLKSCVSVNDENLHEIIQDYFIGDYVASCLSPLHSCVTKIPENRLYPILEKICNLGSVSPKKHGFYLVCMTQNQRLVLESLQKCNLSQSIAMTYQHFAKNPTKESWELLQKKLEKIDNNDYFTSLILANTPAPKHYKAKYFQVAYKIFQKKKNRFTNVLVDKLPKETVTQLTPVFFQSQKDHFFKMRKANEVFSNYVIHGDTSTNVDAILNILKDFKEKSWSFRDSESRQKLNKFVKTFFGLYNQAEAPRYFLVTKFVDDFLKIFPPLMVFEEFVIFSVMKFESFNFAKSVISFHDELLKTYGKLVFEPFAEVLKFCLEQIYKDDENKKLEFSLALFSERKNVEDVLLVLRILPKNRPKLKKSFTFYENLLTQMKQLEDQTIQMHLHIYLNNAI